MKDLTTEQKRAVSHRNGPACIIAGAGTGKTTALAGRILFLVKECGIDPKRILVTTFTRKATAELYERAYNCLGQTAQQLRITTIDGLIVDLAQEAMQCGLMRPAQLIGDAEQRLLLLRSAWETFGRGSGDSKRWWIDHLDSEGVMRLLEKSLRAELADGREKQEIVRSIKSSLQEMRNGPFRRIRIPDYEDLKYSEQRYFEELEKLRATDYNLLARDFLHCFRRNSEFAKKCGLAFDAMLVDEFQDTSCVQAETLLLLAGKRRNIWVVGDACQQIYEWRGAGADNLNWFIKKTGATRYYLKGNWRSAQPILDCAHHFLRRRVPSLKKNGMLKPLKSMLGSINGTPLVRAGNLDQSFWFASQLLSAHTELKPSDIVVLTRNLGKQAVDSIERKAAKYGLKAQFHSSRPDRVMEQTLRNPPNWRPGNALTNLYKHPSIRAVVSRAMRQKSFGDIRTIRPLARVADALDASLPTGALTFREAWPALKKISDREVSVNPSVVARVDAIQVMTIHAAKGLEFPVVLLMKLGNGRGRSFPNPTNPEDARLVYVGATRAKELLVLVHSDDRPKKTLAAFGPSTVAIRRNKKENFPKIQSFGIKLSPPLIAATHLDLYEQCPLKFAAYHEGRFLPKWTIPQSKGARLHKALEYYLRSGMPTNRRVIDQCFKNGLKDGDSPLHKLPQKTLSEAQRLYRLAVKDVAVSAVKVLAVEHRYRYLQGGSGQVEGVVDAVLQRRDGIRELKEWKTGEVKEIHAKRQYDLQARAGALGLDAQGIHGIQSVHIAPIGNSNGGGAYFTYDSKFVDESKTMLEQVFKDLKDRNYIAKSGSHCRACQLKDQCPEWSKR